MNSKERKVPIKNILHMFSYVWDKKEWIDFENISNYDDFDSINILADLFLINIKSIIDRGIYKEYEEHSEEIKGIKGKIDFKESINNLSFENAKSVCIYDELEINNLINQIIKTTAYKLYNTSGLDKANREKLNNVLLKFNHVDIVELKSNIFKEVKFNRNNYYCYYMIMICELINESTMLSEEKGNFKFINIIDNDKVMEKIYELFVYRFYDKKCKDYKVSYQKKLNWNLEGGKQDLIPEMRLDITLENDDETIIIDTKYYKEFAVKSNYSDKKTFISGNLYQIYTYMNHFTDNKKLRGVLLYPFNGESICEEYETETVNNKAKLKIQTIDLTKDWYEIEEDLINIINLK